MGFVGYAFTLVPQPLESLPYWGWLGAILNFINGLIGNAGWTMVIFTILLKLVTLPLDFVSRYKMKKNSIIMADMKEQLEKLERQCKGDKQLYNQRMFALLRKEGYSAGGACLPTLVTLVLFFFVFSGLNQYATYRNAHTFNELVIEYKQMTGQEGLDPVADKEIIDKRLVERYQELNPNWFWVKNPWRPDVAYAEGFFNFIAGVNPIPTYEEFTHTERKSNYGVGAIQVNTDGDHEIGKADYELIMGPIRQSKGQGNGLYILIVLAVGISFLSQYIMQKTQGQPSADSGMNMEGTMKFMMIFFPIMLGFFAFSYSTVFTLYIVTNSILGLLATLFINYIVEKKMKKLKEQRLAAVKYRRS